MAEHRRGTWRVLIAVMLGCFLALSPLAVRGAESVRVGPAPPARPEPNLGRTAAAQSLAVSLPLVTNKAAIDAFIARLYDSQSPDYHHYLTPRQFTGRPLCPLQSPTACMAWRGWKPPNRITRTLFPALPYL